MPKMDRNLILLFIVSAVTAINANMIGTFLPLFIRNLNASVFQVSIVLFLGGLFATVIVMPSGLLLDKYGERTLIILSLMLLGVTPLLYNLAIGWEQMIPWVMINMSALLIFILARMTIIANSVKPSTMATVYGMMNLAWPVGGILGPFLGGFLVDRYGWSLFLYTASLLASLCTVISFFLTSTGGKIRPEEEEAQSESFEKGVLWIIAIFILIHIFGNAARGILRTIFPFYLTENMHKSKTETGLFFSVGFGVATLIVQIPSGFLADKLGRKKVMMYCVLMIPVLTFLFSLIDDYALLLIIYTAITGLWSATWPASAAYLITITPLKKRGFIMSMRQAAVRLGFTVGPLIGGYLWDLFNPPMSFFATTFFFIISFVLILFLKDEMR